MEPLPLTRFQKKRWGPWAPLGGAQNAHLLAVANGGAQDAQLSKTDAQLSKGCGVFCSFSEMSSRVQSLQRPQEHWAGGVCSTSSDFPADKGAKA